MQQSLFPSQEIPAGDHKKNRLESAVNRQVLNQAQYEAVTNLDGPCLVIAGAGSGKTRTLVYRVAHLVESGVAPENILLLTFTRKAAQEMLRRASQIMDASCQKVTGGTFHAVANLLLRRYGRLLGYEPNFTIIDRADAEGIINILKSSLALAGAGKRFPSRRMIINLISKSVNKSVSIDELLCDEYSHLDEFGDDIVTLRNHYEGFKREHGLMDYDDLLVNWQEVLLREPEARREMSDRFRYIMVDEYQDTNIIQAAIVRQLAANHNNVMVVGDDSQSIYSFRGADFRNIMEFPQLFPGTRMIKLEENYRSTQPILDLTNDIIARASEKFSKTLFTNVPGGRKPELFTGRDPAAEARYVVEAIKARQAEGVKLSDMAVLFRSGFHSYKLEIELASRQIEFEKRGGLKLTESAHIKDVLSYFRVLVNGQDHLSWNRILLLLDKIGPKTAARILARVKAAADPLDGLREAVSAGKLAKGLTELAEALAALRQPGQTPAQQFDTLLEYYRPIFERLYYDDYPKRSRDLEQLQGIFAGYDDLQALVADTALEPPAADTGGRGHDPGDRLVLSTIHSAKGLEWDTVFIISLAAGKFPVAPHLPADQWEEERRLFYVAATRAKNKLVMTYPREAVSPHDRRYTRLEMSPFLAEVSPALLMAGAGDNFSHPGGSAGTAMTTPAAAGGRVGRSRSPAGGAGYVTDAALLQKGTVVKHQFFGQGEIEKVVDRHSVDVLFDRHGRKTLHLDYARLELVK